MGGLMRSLKEQCAAIERQFEQLEQNLQALDNDREEEALPSLKYLVSVREELQGFHEQIKELLESVRRDIEGEKNLGYEIRGIIDDIYEVLSNPLHRAEIHCGSPEVDSGSGTVEDSAREIGVDKVEVNGSSEVDIDYLLNKSFPKLQPL